MKKLIFLLVCLISIDVRAANNYTPYELVGYTFEEKQDDELYRYERVTLNRFYKELESEVEYLEKGVNSNKKIDETDYKTESYRTLTKPTEYNYRQLITIKGEDNYIANKLIIEIQNYENVKIKEIEIMNKDRKMKTTSEDVPNAIDGDHDTYTSLNSDKFEITFASQTYVDNLKVTLYIEVDTPLSIIYTVNNLSGSLKISKELTLDNEAGSIVVNTLKYDKYTTFLEENVFKEKDITYYYDYEKILYRHYTPIKDYHTISEEKKLEGYTYDEKESYSMYKVYHREKQEESKETIIEIPGKTITEYVTIKEVEPCECEVVDCVTEKIEDKENTYPAILDTTKDKESITNLETLKEQATESSEHKKCENKPNWWLITGIFFLLVSLILTILYYIDVKKHKE